MEHCASLAAAHVAAAKARLDSLEMPERYREILRHFADYVTRRSR
jgi:hypothetical protein